MASPSTPPDHSGQASDFDTSRFNRLIWLLTISSGGVVANLFYNQPMLGDLARSFEVGPTAIGSVALMTQIGYSAGLLLLTPLGDRYDRRRILLVQYGVLVGALVLAAIASSVAILASASFLIGLMATVAQQMVPLAASLAPPDQRSRAIGRVMSGVLIGILLARTLSGFMAGQAGWRAMFWLAAGIALVNLIVLARLLPAQPTMTKENYPTLLRSAWQMARRYQLLRRAAFIGALQFGAFSTFWSTIAFRFERPPYHLGSEAAGALGLLGAAAALGAPWFGGLADKGNPGRLVGTGAILISAAFALLLIEDGRLWLVLVAVILLDLGVQSAHIANQSRAFALQPDARGRINTVYMTSYYVGGAIGTAIASIAYAHVGWLGVGMAGLLMALSSLIVHWTTPGATADG